MCTCSREQEKPESSSVVKRAERKLAIQLNRSSGRPLLRRLCSSRRRLTLSKAPEMSSSRTEATFPCFQASRMPSATERCHIPCLSCLRNVVAGGESASR